MRLRMRWASQLARYLVSWRVGWGGEEGTSYLFIVIILLSITLRSILFSTPTGKPPDFIAFGITLIMTSVLAMGASKSVIFNHTLNAINLATWVFVMAAGLFYVDTKTWSEHQGFLPYGWSGVSFTFPTFPEKKIKKKENLFVNFHIFTLFALLWFFLLFFRSSPVLPRVSMHLSVSILSQPPARRPTTRKRAFPRQLSARSSSFSLPTSALV